MKALGERIRLWWQTVVEDRSESAPFPLTADEWAIIQLYEIQRQALADGESLQPIKVSHAPGAATARGPGNNERYAPSRSVVTLATLT